MQIRLAWNSRDRPVSAFQVLDINAYEIMPQKEAFDVIGQLKVFIEFLHHHVEPAT